MPWVWNRRQDKNDTEAGQHEVGVVAPSRPDPPPSTQHNISGPSMTLFPPRFEPRESGERPQATHRRSRSDRTEQDTPLEVGANWLYMVRMTQDDVMGGPLGAFDGMPMRCFTDLTHARNWAVMLAIWECLLLEHEVEENLSDPRHTSIV